MDVQNKRVLVVGLARSGLAVARALARHGAVVTVTDRKPPAEFADVLPQLLKDKIGLELGAQREETFLRQEVIVISPGVPWDLPQLQAARQRMIPVYPEVEAATWFLEGTLVGITGSNGKTTTTALLGDMLGASGFPTFVGGNIGNALSSAVDHAPAGTKFVTELSSFQLEGIHEFRPHVAVMLNLSPNHLDRHPNLEAYAQAKRQIFRNQGGQDYAVLNADDPWVAGLQETVPSRTVFFSRRRELPNGVFVSGGKVYYRVRHLERALFETRDVALRGDFNLEDVLAATAAACVLGADFAEIRRAVRAFKAVEHRLEFVREVQGVDFYNNSKATSVDATVKSLEAFERGVHLIMGGKDKGAPYTPLLPLVRERVRQVLLIGAAAPVIAQQLEGSTELVQAGDLATAVYEAFASSRPGDTVLLAPACSSFDQFTDYEERGRVFKELVNRLALDVSAGRAARPSSVPSRHAGDPWVDRAVARARSEAKEVREGGSIASHPGSDRTAGIVPTAAPQDSGRNEGGSSAAAYVSDSGSTPKSAGAQAVPTPPIPPPAEEPPQPEPEAKSEELAEVSDSCGGGGTGLPPGAEDALEDSQFSQAVPRHSELRYVYEVDAVEMPPSEVAPVPEEEPTINIEAGAEEVLDDEVLPFEARPKVKGKAGSQGPAKARNPRSEAQGAKSSAQPSPKQPKLFNGSED